MLLRFASPKNSFSASQAARFSDFVTVVNGSSGLMDRIIHGAAVVGRTLRWGGVVVGRTSNALVRVGSRMAQSAFLIIPGGCSGKGLQVSGLLQVKVRETHIRKLIAMREVSEKQKVVSKD